MAVEANFGQWLKKFRTRLGVSQSAFAGLLGLESHAAIYQAEQKAERRLQAGTVESLLELLGLMWEEELDGLWKQWKLPDMDEVRRRASGRMDPDVVLGFIKSLAMSANLQTSEIVAYLDAGDAKKRGEGGGEEGGGAPIKVPRPKPPSFPGIHSGDQLEERQRGRAASQSEAARKRADDKGK